MFKVPTDQKSLQAFIKRRHPEFKDNSAHWDFLEATYRGGRAWFKKNIFRYIKEGDKEFKDRLERAFRFNHTREVIDLVNKYIFRAQIARNTDDAPDSVKQFWKKATRSGLAIDRYMQQVGSKASIFGRIWLVVDNNQKTALKTVKEQKESGAQVFSYILPPQWVLDMGFDEIGELTWFLHFEPNREDDNPFTASGKYVERYKLWTRENWVLFEVKKKGRDVTVTQIEDGEHDLGVVPVIAADHIETDTLYTSPSMIGEIAYLDRATANYLSNLDAIIQDQAFSQLVMPAQGVLPGEEAYDKLMEMGTKRMFLYDGEHGAKPDFLSPDPKQAKLIVEVINRIIAEIYHTVGLAGERTKQDNAIGIDNASGVAKAFDFDRVNTLLCAKANTLDTIENKLVHLVQLWHGEKDEVEDRDDLVKYPDDYDIRGLYDEFEVAMRLALIDAPETARREQMKMVIEKLFPRIRKDLKKKMLKEAETWEAEEGSPMPPKPDSLKENRQGQVVDGDQEPAE